MIAPEHRTILLDTARASIRHGIEHRAPLPVNPADYPEPLRERRATFVTLEKQGALRGCIGMLEACRPLIEDVAANAYAAAFEDPRFPPVSAGEADELALHISVLSPPEPVAFTDEQDLLSSIRPGTDGLIIQAGMRRGTFLPSVWEQLPDVSSFWTHLKLKAGLPTDYWSDDLKVYRYTTEYIPE